MLNNIKILIFGLLAGLLAAALILIVAAPGYGEPVTLLPTPKKADISIYITGAVQNPGVYVLPAESRVESAVQAAGGWEDKADRNAVNLAALLTDGQTIYIPVPGEEPPTVVVNEKSKSLVIGEIININTASSELLEELPGIGPTKASDIVAYRQKNGAFDTIEAIQNVPGIGPGLFEDIQDLITVSDNP
ncbi:MAG: helix-hairpin-helix domain-containing protein [Bellilinea sp.]